MLQAIPVAGCGNHIVCIPNLSYQCVNAIELDAATRTVKLNAQGETATLSLKQVSQGRQLVCLYLRSMSCWWSHQNRL